MMATVENMMNSPHGELLAGARQVDKNARRLAKGKKLLACADRGPVLPQQPQPEKFGYRVNEAAHFLGVSRSTVYELIADGTLPDLKIGGRRILPADALKKLFE
jgi:excisionase family DNA binding protein